MLDFFQIILINLVVSCDNVGVVAIATRGLPVKQAASARRLGIGLSLALKLLFIGIIGYLFQVTWLHIRIIGGLMLLYVTLHMVRQQPAAHPDALPAGSKGNSYGGVILAIIAADFSMSLDNVIAILSVVSADGEPLGITEYLLVGGGLIACLPLLLWCSHAIAELMERLPILTFLCAGYLVYTAINIISEDETVKLFLQQANFVFAKPAAALCGAFMVLYGVFTAIRRKRENEPGGNVAPLYIGVLLSALFMIGVISHLGTGPIPDHEMPPIQGLYQLLQSGANAVYLLGVESEILCFCCAVYAGIRTTSHAQQEYRAALFDNMRGMLVFALLYLSVTTAGLAYTFGFGNVNLLTWLVSLCLQTALLLTYPAVFSLFRAITGNRVLTVIMGLLYLFVETILAAAGMLNETLLPLAGLLPKYYLSTFFLRSLEPVLALRILLVSALYIGIAVLWGMRIWRGPTRLGRSGQRSREQVARRGWGVRANAGMQTGQSN